MSEMNEAKLVKLSNGKEYTLKMNFRAILNFERRTKNSFFHVVTAMSISDILELFYVFAIEGGTQLSFNELTELSSVRDLKGISDAVGELLKENTPENKAEQADTAKGDNPPLEEMPQE